MTTTSNCVENFSPWELIRKGEKFDNLICTYINSERHFLWRVENAEFNGDVEAAQHVEKLTAQKITEEDSGLMLGYEDIKLGWVCESCNCCKKTRPKIIVEAKQNLCQFINFLSNELLALSLQKKCSKAIRTQKFVWLSIEDCLQNTKASHATLEDIGLNYERIRGIFFTKNK